LLQERPLACEAAIALVMFCAGFALIGETSWQRQAPALQRRLGPVMLTGRVLDIDSVDHGWRIVLMPDRLPGLDATQQPLRLRIHIGPASDLLARSYFVTYKLPLVITRASNNYGPYQFPEKLIPLFIANLLEDRPVPVYGDGLQVRDWLYVEDHCRAILAVLKKGREGEVYNIGGNRSLTNREVIDRILQITDKPASEVERRCVM